MVPRLTCHHFRHCVPLVCKKTIKAAVKDLSTLTTGTRLAYHPTAPEPRGMSDCLVRRGSQSIVDFLFFCKSAALSEAGETRIVSRSLT